MAVLAALLITLFILLGSGGWASFWAVILLLALFCPVLLLVGPLAGGWLFLKAAGWLKELLKHLFRPPDR